MCLNIKSTAAKFHGFSTGRDSHKFVSNERSSDRNEKVRSRNCMRMPLLWQPRWVPSPGYSSGGGVSRRAGRVHAETCEREKERETSLITWQEGGDIVMVTERVSSLHKVTVSSNRWQSYHSNAISLGHIRFGSGQIGRAKVI